MSASDPREFDSLSPSQAMHERQIEEGRMRRAASRAAFLVQRAEDEQTRAEVMAGPATFFSALLRSPA